MPRKRRWQSGPKSSFIERREIAWFDSETHTRMYDVMVQPHDIAWSYERWREKAENQEHIWKRENRLVIRIVVDPEAFIVWCTAAAKAPDGKALEIYVSERANRK